MLNSSLNRFGCVTTPVLINTLEFAEQSLEIHDKIRASNLPRLQDVLFSDRGDVEYKLVGGHARNKLTLRLDVRGNLELMCQRCLGKLDYAVQLEKYFELVEDESAFPESDLDDDDVDYLVIDPKFDVWGFVEEEILLSLPMTFRHEHDCSSGADAFGEQKPNPFRVLEGFKTDKKN